MNTTTKKGATHCEAKRATTELREGNACRLGGYVILNGNEWQTFGDWGKADGGMKRLSGRVKVDRVLDVTWLSKWKVRDFAPEYLRSNGDVIAALAQLPAWKETRWACRWDDFGNGSLIDCKTGALADPRKPEVAAALEKIREHLTANLRAQRQ